MSDYYGPLFLGKGEIARETHEPFTLHGPLIETWPTISNFKPIGAYGVFRVRKHWWQLWKPKTKGWHILFGDHNAE